MTMKSFPPNIDRNEFSPFSLYEEAMEKYPTVADLMRKKSIENGDRMWMEFQDGRTFTYQDAENISNKVASGLYQTGIRADDRVAIFALNSPEWIFCYFGILKIGAVPITVNVSFIKDPLIYNLVAANAGYLIIDWRLLSKYKEIEDSIPDIKHVFILGKNQMQSFQTPKKNFSFVEDLLKTQADPACLVTRQIGDASAMILTSGTTGHSKVVYTTNAQFITTALFLIDAGGVKKDSVFYSFLPLFHIMALDMATILSMLANAKLVLVEMFNPEDFWEHVKKYNVTHFAAVGPIIELLFKQPPSELEKNHSSLTALAYCSKEIWEMARKRFGINITGGYGSTEVGIPISSPNHLVSKGANPPGSCGKVGPHVEVAIMDDQGRFLPYEKIGEIVVRPKLPWAIFRKYYGMRDATASAFRGLWFHTDDAGYFDEAGFLYFVDRVKDAIRRKGENISSYEVEQILLKYPKIAQVAVIPAANEVGDDEVMAVTVPAESGVKPDEIVAFCSENMPHFWIPRFIRFVGALPMTATGRIEKFKLKQEGVTADTWDRKKI